MISRIDDYYPEPHDIHDVIFIDNLGKLQQGMDFDVLFYKWH